MRFVAMLALCAACGARAAPAPVANHGGAEPAELQVLVLDGKALMLNGGTWLDRPTPVTVEVRWKERSGEGMVKLDGKVLGSVPQTFVVPAGRHHVDFELPGMD